MANGQPPAYSARAVEAMRTLRDMERRGASPKEIEDYLTSVGAERVNNRGAMENLARGFALGGAEGVASTIGAGGFLTGSDRAQGYARDAAERNRTYYDPLGVAGTVGRVGGRITSEVAQAMLVAPVAAKLVGNIPGIGSRVTRALESGSRLKRAGATAALSSPIDVVQGIKSEEPFLLPKSTGMLGSIAENVGLSGAVGAILPAARIPESRRLGAGTTQQALPAPTQRLLPAPATAPVEAAEEAATAAPRTFYGGAEAPTTVPPRTFYGQPSGPASLELPGAAKQVEEAIPAATPVAAAAVASEAPKYPLSYYADWIFGSKKNPLGPKEALKIPEGDVVGVAGSPDEWGYLSLIVKQKKGKRSVNVDVDVRPVMTEDGLKLERVDLTDPPPRTDGGYQSGYEQLITGRGEFIGTPRTAPVPDKKQLARWRKQEERLERKAQDLDEDELLVPPAAPAVTAAVAGPETGTYVGLRGRAVADIVGAKTGQPFRSMMLRGKGGSAVSGTGNAAILGKARYTTPDETYAREFAQDASGKMVGKVSAEEVYLKNPLVIDSDSQWRALTKRAGWFSPNPTGMPQKDLTKQISALRRIVEADGHDGIIVRIPRDYEGAGSSMRMGAVDERYGKTLDRVFGADQIIEFAPQTWAKARPGFAQMQAITTLGGAGLGATAGALTGTDRETRISGAIGGGLLGAGLGVAAGRQLARPMPPAARGSTPDLQEINRTINVGERPKNTTDWLSGFQRFMTNWVVQERPMELAARQAAGAKGEQILKERIAQAQGAGQAAKQYLIDNVQPALLAARGKFDDVRALLKARRDLDIRMRGGAEKSDVPTEVLERAIKDAEADPAVKNAADAINNVYRDLLTRKYKSGMMTFATYKNILDSEDFYTPFVREFVDDVNVGGATGRGKKWTVRSSGVNRMDRTMQADAQTADPLEVLQASVERTFKDIGRQNVQNVLSAFADLDKIPNLIRRVDGEVTPGAATFTQMRGGRPVQYEVLDKELYDAIAGQSPSSISNMMLLKIPAVLLRAGVTLRPVFAITNAIRDIAMSGIQRPDVQRAIREMAAGGAVGGTYGAFTAEDGERMKAFLRGAGMGVGVGAYARPALQTAAAVRSVIGATLPPNAPDIVKRITGDGNDYQKFLRLGGSTEGWYVRNASDAQEFLQRMERSGTIKDIINPGSVYRALTYIGSVSEQSTRLAAFKQLKEAGFTDAAAVLGAQDRTLRFAQRGKIGARFADIAAFWNPRVQGMVKLGQMLKDPKTLGMGAAMITAPTLTLWNINKDNPEYWDTPVWERNLFWLVPKSGPPDEYGKVGFWRIPKPFEIGILFASLPERILDAVAMSGVDTPLLQTAAPLVTEPGRAVRETVGTALGEAAYGLLPIPTVAQVPLQLMTNRDIFRDRPIVSRQDLPAPQQVTPESSALARVLAERGISPQKTDFAIRGTFGGLGTDVSNVIDAAVRAAGGAAPEPRAPRTGSSKFIPRQLQTRTYSATESESSARDLLKRLEGVNRGLLKEAASNDPDRITAYQDRYQDELFRWSMLKTYKGYLDDIAAQRRAVIADKRIPQSERWEILTSLRKNADMAAREILSFGARQ